MPSPNLWHKERLVISRLNGKYQVEDRKTGHIRVYDDYIKAIRAQAKTLRRLKKET